MKKKERISKMNGLRDRCYDRMEKIGNELRVRNDKVPK